VATGPVADVAFELDGREVARVFDRPFRQPLDFGAEYAPHELVARAHDAKGKEIALARQWINLPRPPAEVQIVFEKDKSGKAVAVGLAWASRMGPRPTGVVLTFDGQPLSVDVTRHARLPEYDASLPHVVSAQVEFPGGLHGRADRVLAGGSADEAGSELTAVPVRGPNGRPLSIESLQGRLRKNGEALRVVAVEHGPGRWFSSSAIRPGTRRPFDASARTTTTSRGRRRVSRSKIAFSSSGRSPRRYLTRARRTSSSTPRKSFMA